MTTMCITEIPHLKLASVIDIHARHPFYITFEEGVITSWRIDEQSGTLRRMAQFSHFVSFPGMGRCELDAEQMAPIIDVERDLVIIPQSADSSRGDSPSLWTFTLTTGKLLRTIKLYGRWEYYPLHYRDGRSVVVLNQARKDISPYGRTVIVVCDTAGDGRLVGGIYLPRRLQEREQSNISTVGGVLRCIYAAPGGDIIGTSSKVYEDTIEVLRWRAGDLSTFPEPDASLTLTASLEGCDRTYPSCSAPLDDASLLLAVSEEVTYAPLDGFHCQLAVYAIDWEKMTVRWRAEPIWGVAHGLWHVPTHEVVVIAGERQMGPNKHAFIAALNSLTGAIRCIDTINVDAQGASPLLWALSEDRERPNVVVIFTDGSLCTVPLQDFVRSGIPRDGELVRAQRTVQEGLTVNRATLGRRSALLSASDDKGTSYVFHVLW